VVEAPAVAAEAAVLMAVAAADRAATILTVTSSELRPRARSIFERAFFFFWRT
jgi:hypothetical protein